MTLATSLPQITYGTRVTLSGAINVKKAGENVQLTYLPYGQGSEAVLATVLTGADGTYTFNVTPKILTTYRAVWKTASSLPVQTAVAPTISFGRLNGFVTRVYAGRSMARKQVQLQRLSSFGQWVTIKRVSLDLNSRARFEAPMLPIGHEPAADRVVGEPGRRRLPRRVQQGDRLSQVALATRARILLGVSARREPSAAEERTERPRSRTEQAVGCTTGPILKTGWATGPVPLRR